MPKIATAALASIKNIAGFQRAFFTIYQIGTFLRIMTFSDMLKILPMIIN
jgi:hypothetical protein